MMSLRRSLSGPRTRILPLLSMQTEFNISVTLPTTFPASEDSTSPSTHPISLPTFFTTNTLTWFLFPPHYLIP